MKQFLALLALMMTFVTGAAVGQNSSEPFVRMVWVRSTYMLNDDASHTETQSWAMKVLQEKAIERAKHAAISYSASIQNVEVLEAYTLKADGKRIDVPKSNFQLNQNAGKDKNAPVFSDFNTISAVFPEVSVGDTVVFAYKLTQREPIFPGHFSIAAQYPKLYAYDEVKVRIDAPAKLWTQFHSREMNEQITAGANGRKVVEWTFENKTPPVSKRRNYSVYDPEADAGYAFSTFKSYADIATAYGARAIPKAVVSDRVRELATEITRGAESPRDQTKALYDWVATKINYAGNCVGVGAVVPHDVSFILDNRIGDCKDHATLLQALLAAKGIKSTQALINAGNVYKLPRIPVVANVNHVINYIPSLDLFLDSTANTTPFGLLPYTSSDKPVLLVEGYKDGVKTPADPIDANHQYLKNVVTVHADGSATSEVEVRLKGWYAVAARERMKELRKEIEDQTVRNVLRSFGYVGTGTLDYSKPEGLSDTYNYSAKLSIKDFVQRPGAGAFVIAPMLGERTIAAIMQNSLDPEEEYPAYCTSVFSVEEYIYRFPPEIKIIAVPETFKLANDFLSYSVVYDLKGETLTVKRELDDKSKGNVCAPAIAIAYKDFAAKVLPSLKSQVLYK
jgi:transglutaminase-like putative cysteine protease